jgi:hypothetical protein
MKTYMTLDELVEEVIRQISKMTPEQKAEIREALNRAFPKKPKKLVN